MVWGVGKDEFSFCAKSFIVNRLMLIRGGPRRGFQGFYTALIRDWQKIGSNPGVAGERRRVVRGSGPGLCEEAQTRRDIRRNGAPLVAGWIDGRTARWIIRLLSGFPLSRE